MEEDRISKLPNDILQHILSFIDPTQAVQTTILSKRWKNLWRSLPDLHFYLTRAAAVTSTTAKNTRPFYHRFPGFLRRSKNEKSTESSSLRFPRFVSGFLSRRDATAAVRDFHLSFEDIIHPNHPDYRNLESFVEECTLYAINHGVQSLRINVPQRCSQRLPTALFASTTLRELDLRLKETWIYVPARFSLPKLKTLYLEARLTFGDRGKEWFAGLPELEMLSLRGDLMLGLVLKAPKLRVLEILESSHFIEEISAPLLTSFRYEGHSPLECSMMNLPKLEDVYIDIHGIRQNRKWLRHKCVRMLHQLGNATNVTLTLDTLKFLEPDGNTIEQSPPPFPNIKCLKLMKGRHGIRTVLQSVMNYLTVGTLFFELLMPELPYGVTVVEKNFDD